MNFKAKISLFITMQNAVCFVLHLRAYVCLWVSYVRGRLCHAPLGLRLKVDHRNLFCFVDALRGQILSFWSNAMSMKRGSTSSSSSYLFQVTRKATKAH